jgi:hypothetical protein
VVFKPVYYRRVMVKRAIRKHYGALSGRLPNSTGDHLSISDFGFVANVSLIPKSYLFASIGVHAPLDSCHFGSGQPASGSRTLWGFDSSDFGLLGHSQQQRIPARFSAGLLKVTPEAPLPGIDPLAFLKQVVRSANDFLDLIGQVATIEIIAACLPANTDPVDSSQALGNLENLLLTGPLD